MEPLLLAKIHVLQDIMQTNLIESAKLALLDVWNAMDPQEHNAMIALEIIIFILVNVF